MQQQLIVPKWLLVATTLLIALQVLPTQGQQDFTTAQIPNPFRVGVFYPPRSEVEVCRPIRDYIDRNSARFTNELVTNTNADITFSTSDSRIMSSRMQSRLNSLATLYKQETGRRMTVLRAWTQFPNAQISDSTSLHYEGECLQNYTAIHVMQPYIEYCAMVCTFKAGLICSTIACCIQLKHCKWCTCNS